MAACAHSTTTSDLGSESLSGSVSGVITLPDANANNCTQLAVYATATDDKGAVVRVGRPSVHQGTGRCSYQISNLPPDLQLNVHVEPPAGMTCGNGTTLAFAATSADSFTLKSDEIRTRDFSAQCSGTATSSG